MRRLLLGTAAALALAVPHAAEAAIVEDFSGLSGPASSFTGLFGGLGSVAASTGLELNVYPTDDTGGADPDLEAGNDLAGSGFGNALIIQEDGITEPDDRGGGGSYTFTFTTPIDLIEVTFLDVEEAAGIDIASNLGDVVSGANCGANGCVDVLNFAALPNTKGVSEVTFTLAGSGAIDDFTVTPIPGALVLFGSGVAALAWARRRAASSTTA